MKNMIEVMKSDLISMRKERHGLSKLMSMLISECEMVGKNDGDRMPSDSECLLILKKAVSNNTKTMEAAPDREDIVTSLKIENEFISKYLPQMTSNEDISAFIRKSCNGLDKGKSMSLMKSHFGQSIDMRIASQLFDEDRS